MHHSDEEALHAIENFNTATMTVRYAVGSQEREALVLTGGFRLDDHLERLQSGAGGDTPDWVTFLLAGGGGIGLRLDSIVAIEMPR